MKKNDKPPCSVDLSKKLFGNVAWRARATEEPISGFGAYSRDRDVPKDTRATEDLISGRAGGSRPV